MERRDGVAAGHKTRRNPTKNIEYYYATPPCEMRGCRAVETSEFKLFNSVPGNLLSRVPATEWYCERHARRMIYSEYRRYADETGRRS